MTVEQLINRPCLLVRRSKTGPQDSFGNPEIVTTTVETECELQPVSVEQTTESGLIATSTLNAFFHTGEDVQPGDELITLDDGRGYTIDGEPVDRRNPRTGIWSHVAARAKRTAGLDWVS